MVPASRIKCLLAAHCGLAWFTTGAIVFADYPFVSALVGATLALFCSQVVVSGLVAGLLLSGPPAATHDRHKRPLTWLCLGLPSLWAPVALLMVRSGEIVGPFMAALYGLCMAIGLFALVVAVTLAAFKLQLTDEPNDEPPSPRKFQFSLRQLIALTTFIAVACALPKLAAASKGYISVLAGTLLVLSGIALGVAAIWSLTIGIPLGAVLFARHPCRAALVGLVTAEIIVTGACFALNEPGWVIFAPSLLLLTGGYLITVMASLGVLRSCGLRLVPRRIENDSPSATFETDSRS